LTVSAQQSQVPCLFTPVASSKRVVTNTRRPDEVWQALCDTQHLQSHPCVVCRASTWRREMPQSWSTSIQKLSSTRACTAAMTCHIMTTAQVCEPGCTSCCCHTQQVADTDAAVTCTHLHVPSAYGAASNVMQSAASCLFFLAMALG